ncbi:hypothetical protein V8F20_010236 [Naviculisporaceae sp. PSN 640]
MLATRNITRAAPRAARAAPKPRTTQRRFQSTSPSSNAAPQTSHMTSGVIGGVIGASLLYGIFLMTPSGKAVRKVNNMTKELDAKYQEAVSTLKAKTPNTDEAINSIKQFCYSYVAWIPGGRQYVDIAFKDFESVRETNRDETDKLINDAYRKFQDIAKSGLSVESLTKTYDALRDLSQQLAKIAGKSVDQILENHPELKDKVGGPIEQLKQMGDQYGPEAKKMVNDTWDQVGEVMAGGFSAANIDKIRKLVEEKSQQLKKFGDQAWAKGLDQAKPYLDKNPKLKSLIMDNQDLLKNGDVTGLFKRVKSAAESGDLSSLQEYVKSTVDKASGSASKASGLTSGGFASLAQFMGGQQGSALKDNIQLLSKVIEEHASEGEDLLKETRDDLKKLLEDKAKKAQKIVDNAQKQKQ